MDGELREWLGLTLADLLVYLAVAVAACMFITGHAVVDVVLATAAVVLAIASCPLGMKPDPAVSAFTNRVKLISYPLCVLLVAAVIVAHYLWLAFRA